MILITAMIGIMIGTLRLPVDKITTSISGSWIPCVVLAIIGFVLIIVMEKKFNYIED